MSHIKRCRGIALLLPVERARDELGRIRRPPARRPSATSHRPALFSSAPQRRAPPAQTLAHQSAVILAPSKGCSGRMVADESSVSAAWSRFGGLMSPDTLAAEEEVCAQDLDVSPPARKMVDWRQRRSAPLPPP
jgi:hypothetical protein